MTELQAIESARDCFLNNGYGCAETVLIVLQQAYALENAQDSSPAMALNGGVAWSGNLCGPLSAAAMAAGQLAAQRIGNRRTAKRIARRIIAHCLDEFQAQYGSVNCRDLIRQDIHTEEQHAVFIESGLWRTQCMSQIEFTIRRLYPLCDEQVWRQVLAGLASH